MTGTREALGGSAAFDDAAQSVTRPFYAVLANTLFQRGGQRTCGVADGSHRRPMLVRRGATARYVKINSRFTMLGTVTSGAAVVLGGQLQQISWGVVYVGSASCLVLAVVVLMPRVPEIRGADAVDEQNGTEEEHGDTTAWRAMLRVATLALVTLVVDVRIDACDV